MLFVKNEDLKVGMRLAKPIYNKKGVLLYERNSKLTEQGIDSVKNFGLIGLYILEPAEPVPPMTKDDIEFERFQTMAVFAIQDELLSIKNTGKSPRMQQLVATIIRSYGRLDHKINFVQSLRSNEDYVFKHSLNVAILAAMMTHVLNVRLEEQNEIIIAALVHDIGKLNIPVALSNKKGEYTTNEKAQLLAFEKSGAEMIESTFAASPAIKRMMSQSFRAMTEWKTKGTVSDNKMVLGSSILLVAEMFDTMTAMNNYEEPSSEIKALRYLMENPEFFDERVVDALTKSINILSVGCCIELSNGEKGLVLNSNDVEILKPMILCFGDNRIVDLSHELIYEDLEIRDVMKTMDNRCVIDREMLKKYGVSAESGEN